MAKTNWPSPSKMSREELIEEVIQLRSAYTVHARFLGLYHEAFRVAREMNEAVHRALYVMPKGKSVTGTPEDIQEPPVGFKGTSRGFIARRRPN